MSQYIDLGRRFFKYKEYAEHERLHAEMLGHHVPLKEVLAHRFVVVVAPANYGKTTEFIEAAACLRLAEEAAIFTKLKDVRSAGEQKAAFDDENWQAFENWLELGTSTTLTIFLDSLDEANLGEPLDLLNGLRRLGDWAKWPNDSVRWVISTRPAVLTLQNQKVIEGFLLRTFSTVAHSQPANPRPGERCDLSNRRGIHIRKCKCIRHAAAFIAAGFTLPHRSA
jgi:hypothetical protein